MDASDQTEYSEKYVLFLDVLGWSSLMSDTQDDYMRARNVAGCLAAAFKEGCSGVKKSGGHPATPRFEFFSDSIIITIPFIGGEVYWPEEVAFDISRKIALSTLEYGFLVRGGLTRGAVYHDSDNNICFGPALVRAYSLESKVAIYPRIVIDPSIRDFLDSHDTIMSVDAKGSEYARAPSMRKMDDGIAFIDYLAPRYLSAGKVSGGEVEVFEKNIRYAKTIAKDGVKSKNISIDLKYEWFKAYVKNVEMSYSRNWIG